MARTIQDVTTEIINAEQVNGLPALLTPSATAIRRLWRRIVASAIVTVEQMFDWFKADIGAILDSRRPHTTRFYRKLALAFQYGHALILDSTSYDNTGLTAQQIETAQIVKQAAATERNGLLIVKAATLVNNQLAPLSTGQLTALTNYMNEVKDVGVPMSVQSFAPDLLRLTIDIYYNTAILNGVGIDGTALTPIQDAINGYLRLLEFNGVFSKTRLTDAMQTVAGVVAPEVKVLTVARWDAATNYVPIEVFHEPYSGYYTLNNLTLNFIPYG